MVMNVDVVEYSVLLGYDAPNTSFYLFPSLYCLLLKRLPPAPYCFLIGPLTFPEIQSPFTLGPHIHVLISSWHSSTTF
jgi:hypothetical protein